MLWKRWLVRSALLSAVLVPAAAYAAGVGGAGGCCPLCGLLGR